MNKIIIIIKSFLVEKQSKNELLTKKLKSYYKSFWIRKNLFKKGTLNKW